MRVSFRTLGASLFTLLLVDVVSAQQKPITYVPVPGSPFRAIFAVDGQHVFVSETGGIGVLAKSVGGEWSQVYLEALPKAPVGIRLSADGGLLIAAENDGVSLLNVAKLVAGAGKASIGSITYGKSPGCIEVNATPDERFLFVSNEWDKSLTVIDLQRALREGPSASDIVGKIPVGIAPIALCFSPDMATLYNTSERAAPEFGWPYDSSPEGNPKPAKAPQGAVIVIDVKLAETDPSHAVLKKVPSGSSPVRMVLSADGSTAYVTVRGSNCVFVYDTTKLASADPDACVAKIPVGPSPVGLALVDGGKKLIVANSNRFASKQAVPETLSVIDTTRITEGKGAVMGTLPAGVFPREVQLSPDGRTLAVTNYNSKTVEIIDVTRLSEVLVPTGKN